LHGIRIRAKSVPARTPPPRGQIKIQGVLPLTMDMNVVGPCLGFREIMSVQMQKIFKRARLAWTGVHELDTSDLTFSVAWPSGQGPDKLAGGIGIKSSGQADPVWVQETVKGKKYRLVHGFMRVAVARRLGLTEVPALVLDNKLEKIVLFQARLAGHQGRFSAVEAAAVLDKLDCLFQPGADLLAETFLPLLGLGRGRHLLEQCRKLKNLEQPAAAYCAEKKVGLGEAVLWAGFPVKAQRAILAFVKKFHPGGNLLKSYLRLLGEISLRQGMPVEKVLENKTLQEIARDPQVARSGGRERAHARLRELRYPVLSGIDDKFSSLRRKLGLEGKILVEPPRFFEGDRLRISMETGSPEDLSGKAQQLLNAAKRKEFGEMFHLLGAPEPGSLRHQDGDRSLRSKKK
ncbi:MAG: ParB N-terminal domain-containing protein, partial [Gemmatimonadota bacterium]|nr:ParB N-terminal domain-containing protein [Gemmatimonadota bacterium]